MNLSLNRKHIRKPYKKIFFYSVFKVVLIACGQSVALKSRKTEKYVRNNLICVYCLSVIAALIITLFFCETCQSLNIKSFYLFMINSVYAYSVVNAVIFYDDFLTELDHLIRVARELGNTPKTDLSLIVEITLVTLLNFFIFIYSLNSFFTLSLQPSVLISSIVYMLFYFLFLKIIILINEFTVVVKALNRLTKETIESKSCIRDICLFYTSLETRFPKINGILDPMLLPTLLMNFVKIFIQPYLSTRSAIGSQFQWSWAFTTHLLWFMELMKLYTISDVCGKLSSEFAKWWDLVELSESSMSLIEMNKRGIKPYKEKRVSIKLYNMLVIDSNYITVVLLTTLNYAYFMTQNK